MPSKRRQSPFAPFYPPSTQRALGTSGHGRTRALAQEGSANSITLVHPLAKCATADAGTVSLECARSAMHVGFRGFSTSRACQHVCLRVQCANSLTNGKGKAARRV